MFCCRTQQAKIIAITTLLSSAAAVTKHQAVPTVIRLTILNPNGTPSLALTRSEISLRTFHSCKQTLHYPNLINSCLQSIKQKTCPLIPRTAPTMQITTTAAITIAMAILILPRLQLPPAITTIITNNQLHNLTKQLNSRRSISSVSKSAKVRMRVSVSPSTRLTTKRLRLRSTRKRKSETFKGRNLSNARSNYFKY